MRAIHGIGLFLLLSLVCIGACQTPATDACDERVCPLGSVCTPSGDSCVLPEQIAGCQGLNENDRCSYAGEPDGVCLDSVCYPQSACGNGVVEAELGEVCDEGDANSDEPDAACRTNCQPQACGDGVVDPDADEDCDDGNVFPGDGCSVFCISEVCGNGIIDLQEVAGTFLPAEDCDDGANDLNHDGCTKSCVAEEPRWRTVLGAAPSGRKNHIMAYDAARGRVVLFGGVGNFGSESDTWEWDGTNWTQRFPNNSPTFKANDVMTYDAARQRIVLFADASNDLIPGGTWEWDGTNWSKLAPSVSPTVLFPAITYDAARARVVLFGIDDAAGVETWEWDGMDWTQLSPVDSPGYRFDHAMAYDAARGRVVLFGGFGIIGGGSQNRLGDTWEWDGTNWEEIVPGGAAPMERDNHSMVFDAGRGRVTLFGGHARTGNPTHLSDIWEWNGSNWAQRFPGGSTPAGRNQHAMAYDTVRKRLVLFAGETLGGTLPSKGETWEWNGSAWTKHENNTAPVERIQHDMAYDSERGETLLFGGIRAGGSALLGDTWVWNGKEWQIRPVGTAPDPRSQHTMAYDRSRQRVVLFGGGTISGATNETWEWDGSNWSAASSLTNPRARTRHAMVYDAARGRVLLFGGRTVTTGSANDTWAWDGTTWEEVSPTNSPSGRTGHSMAYDPVRERVVLFGGVDAGGARDDTWEWDGVVWTEVASAMVPAGREEHTMIYDATRERIVLFGGSRNAGQRLNDTWEWDGSEWTRSFLSTESPSVRSEHAMAYDGARSLALLFGGRSNSALPLTETWTFQYTSGIDEVCTTDFDSDGDGLVGCADPDCWGRCTPSCLPSTTCDTDAPNCGDGMCNSFLENRRLCPQDCGAPSLLCGDAHCDIGETMQNCPGDCTP